MRVKAERNQKKKTKLVISNTFFFVIRTDPFFKQCED